MSFAGHVYDMIRRNKENREMLELRRERHLEAQQKRAGGLGPSALPDMTAAEWDRIERELKARDKRESTYAFRIKLLVLGIGIGVILLIWIWLK